MQPVRKLGLSRAWTGFSMSEQISSLNDSVAKAAATRFSGFRCVFETHRQNTIAQLRSGT